MPRPGERISEHLLVIGTCLLAGGCEPCQRLSRTESVTFQPSSGHELPEGGKWSVTLRGAIYRKSFLNRIEPELIDFMEAHKFVEGSVEATTLDKRLAPLLEDHVKGMTLGVLVADRLQPLIPSDSSGRLKGDLILTDEEVSKLQSGPDGKKGPRWITLSIQRASWDHREVLWRIQVLPKRGLSIVSDIDDTIKITNVNNTKEMLKNTFLLPYRAVPGMAELYATWAGEKGAAFYYLSESSVELCVPLSEFLVTAGYPEGSLDLREIAWGRHRLKGFMSLMDAPPEYKIDELKRIIGDFPNRDYVLIGDSSQHDPEVYAETARRYPTQIRRILIRDVTCEGPESPRYQRTFHDLPKDLWRIFREPAEIKDAIPEPGA